MSVQVEYACVINTQALRTRLALQMCCAFRIGSAFLSETWAAPTASSWMWSTCVRSPTTSCCSQWAPLVFAPCRCTPDSSPHASPLLCETTCYEWHSTRTPTRFFWLFAAGIAASQREREARSAAPRH